MEFNAAKATDYADTRNAAVDAALPCALAKPTSTVCDHDRARRIVVRLARPVALALRRLMPASTFMPCRRRGKEQKQHGCPGFVRQSWTRRITREV